MSSSRRESSLDQRPRRRRRIEGEPFGTVPNTTVDEMDTTSSMTNANLVASPFQAVNSLESGSNVSTSLDSEDPPHTGPDSVHNEGDGYVPFIPIDALFHAVKGSTENAAASSDPIRFDSDDSEEDARQALVDGGWHDTGTAVSDNMPARRRNFQGLQGMLQDRYRTSRVTRTKGKPKALAPPTLLLYGTEYRQNVLPSHSVRYLPLIQATRSTQPSDAVPRQRSSAYMIQSSHKQRIDSQGIGAFRARWIPSEMPVELFEAITQYLSRDDIKSMRLVSREFERGVSQSLFNTVVVPFNTELYEMIEHENSAKQGNKIKDQSILGSLQWKNAKEDREDKVYRGHGLRVFEGFGSHIRRFGMSFEVREDAIQSPPRKKALDTLESYFGNYDWPAAEYTRFEKLAGLERTADETSQMKVAFSHLTKVHHLALSLDSGLGWMQGPDKSLRTQILQPPPSVFGGCSHGIVDAQRQERDFLWESLESAYRAAGKLTELKGARLQRAGLQTAISDIQGLRGSKYCDSGMWSNVDGSLLECATPDNGMNDQVAPSCGILYVRPHELDAPEIVAATEAFGEASTHGRTPPGQTFLPNNLSKHQKEWLLEAEWAQRAFLMSYMLAVVDNRSVFSKITMLNLARISSCLVPLFYRHDFWEALPKLADVTIGVIPDWRTVERDEAGFVETRDVEPSKAHDAFYWLLQDYVGIRSSVKKLKLLWADGGEHADGIFARNQHVLPAPTTLLQRTFQPLHDDQATLRLPHVEHLILSNCWISPTAVTNLVSKLEQASLKRITFDSVSLTAHPRNMLVNGANQHAAMGFGAQNFQPLFQPPWGVIPGGPGLIAAPPAVQQFGALFWQGPPPMQPHNAWAHGMLQQMNQILAHNDIPPNQIAQIRPNPPIGMMLDQMLQALNTLAVGMPFVFPGQAPHALPAAGFQGGFGVAPAPATAAIQTSNEPWYEGHREGSWVDVINNLSPGTRLDMYRPHDEFEPAPAKRVTRLVSMEFISCGYIQLQSAPFDQSVFEPLNRTQAPLMRRRSALHPVMLSSMDRHLGTIVQHMSEREEDALGLGWGMRMGWDDERKAEEVEYDGQLAGGTGRFSGHVTKDTALTHVASARVG